MRSLRLDAVPRGSPYRSRSRAVSIPRSLSFFHGRLLLLTAIATPVFGLCLWFITTPRAVSLDCEPTEAPGIRCQTRVESIWGTDVDRVTVKVRRPRPPSTFSSLTAPSPLENLEIETDYTRRQRTETHSRIIARNEIGTPVPLTPLLPDSADRKTAAEVVELGASLRRGEAGRVEYRTRWGGLVSSVGLAFLMAAFVWIRSGRTRVRVAPESNRVEVETRSFWLTKPSRRELARHDIARVVVAKLPGYRRGHVYLPALELHDGEVVHLGEEGLGTPARAEHFVKLLGERLELENGNAS